MLFLKVTDQFEDEEYFAFKGIVAALLIPELGMCSLSKIDFVKGFFFNSCCTSEKGKLNLEEASIMYLTQADLIKQT